MPRIEPQRGSPTVRSPKGNSHTLQPPLAATPRIEPQRGSPMLRSPKGNSHTFQSPLAATPRIEPQRGSPMLRSPKGNSHTYHSPLAATPRIEPQRGSPKNSRRFQPQVARSFVPEPWNGSPMRGGPSQPSPARVVTPCALANRSTVESPDLRYRRLKPPDIHGEPRCGSELRQHLVIQHLPELVQRAQQIARLPCEQQQAHDGVD